MNKEIKLPPRPKPDGFITIHIIGHDVEVNAYRDSTMEVYATQAVEAALACTLGAIEAEVRKDDEALIRQLVEALTTLRATGAHEGFAHDVATTAITAGRARLKSKP